MAQQQSSSDGSHHHHHHHQHQHHSHHNHHPATNYHHPLHSNTGVITPGNNKLAAELDKTTLQAKVKILAKINFWITFLPFSILSIVLLLLYFKSDLVQEHARTNNDSFYAPKVDEFLSMEKDQQWKTFLIQYGWETAEVILAYVLILGARNRDYGYLKAWLLLMTVSFLAELTIQGSLLASISFKELQPGLIILIVTFCITDLYRFSCLFIVYLLVDEMLEANEVPRDRGRPLGNGEEDEDDD